MIALRAKRSQRSRLYHIYDRIRCSSHGTPSSIDMVEGEQDEFEGKENSPSDDKASQMAAAYAKGRIPKPVVSETNVWMKTLNDDDLAFMRKAMLVGGE